MTDGSNENGGGQRANTFSIAKNHPSLVDCFFASFLSSLASTHRAATLKNRGGWGWGGCVVFLLCKRLQYLDTPLIIRF